MFKYLVCVGLAVLAVEGCHDKKRRRRAVDDINIFFDDCMTEHGISDFTWASVVDFVINHGSWYAADGNMCKSSGPSMYPGETECWLSALEYLLTEPDLVKAKLCVCKYLTERSGMTESCPAGILTRRKRQAAADNAQLNDEECPYVSPQTYAERLFNRIQQMNELFVDDRTSENMLSVVNFVRKEGLCLTNCNCTTNYTSSANITLPCTRCWPTRLDSMVKESSPLKPLVVQITNELSGGSEQPTTVECDHDLVSIHIGETHLESLEFGTGDRLVMSRDPVTDVSQVEVACVGTARNNFFVGIDDCGVDIIKNETYLEFKFTIWKVTATTGIVARFKMASICLSCMYTSKYVVESPRLLPMLRHLKLDLEAEEGSFLVTMGFYEDNFETEIPPNSMVKVPDYINVCVILHLQSQLVIQIIDCWATQDPGNDLTSTYPLISAGFPDQGHFDGVPIVEILNNGNDSVAWFRFQSFVWSGDFDAVIFVKCRVCVCDPDADNCILESSRKKRKADRPDNVHFITSGPIRVVTNQKLCRVGNGGCSDFCKSVGGNVICSCFAGRSLGRDDKTCHDDSPPASEQKETIQAILMNPVVTVVLFIAVLIFGIQLIRK